MLLTSLSHSSFAGLGFIESDTAYRCIIAYNEGKLQSGGGIESTYISKSYNNWKDAAVKFSSHEVSVS